MNIEFKANLNSLTHRSIQLIPEISYFYNKKYLEGYLEFGINWLGASPRICIYKKKKPLEEAENFKIFKHVSTNR